MRSAFKIASLAGSVVAHMGLVQDNSKVVDLGDITANSWAVATSIAANEVHYYKFNIKSLTYGKKPKDDYFMMGLYVPYGDEEKDFTYFAAFYGLPADSKCERWADGWGRRLGAGEPGHHDKDVKKTYSYKRTFKNEGSVVMASKEAIPDFVKPKTDLKDVLIFEATSETKIAPKFEPFSPNIF